MISFVAEGSIDISDALPDNVEYQINGIISEGGATTQLYPGYWVGSMTKFNGGKGYWMLTSEAISFSYDLNSLSRTINSGLKGTTKFDEYQVEQSIEQAF